MNQNNIFIDTNIFIGAFVDKKSADGNAIAYLYNLVGKRLYTSTLCIAQLIATLQRRYNNKDIKAYVEKIMKKVSLVQCADEDIEKSLSLPYDDLEDNLQYTLSSNVKCFYFVTNNEKDYHCFNNIVTISAKSIRRIPQSKKEK